VNRGKLPSIDAPLSKSAIRPRDFLLIIGYVQSVRTQVKRLALVVEGPTGHAHVILDALGRGDPACKVIVKHDGLEALDYLLCREAYAERDGHIMPCVTLLDLAQPPSDGLGVLREMRAHEQTKLLPVVVFSSAEEHPQAAEIYAAGANSYIGLRPGNEPFEESIRQVAHYWCVINDPPPPL
jgi:two-component system, response regulator